MKKLINIRAYLKTYAFLFFCCAIACAYLWLPQQLTKVTAQKANVSKNKTFAAEPPENIVVNSQNSADAVRKYSSAETAEADDRSSIAPEASYTNSTPITITDCPNPCPASGQAASLYPSPITVAGETGVIQRVSVTLNGLSHAFPADMDFLLVSPSGRKSVIMSDFGAGSPGVSNINVTLDDYAATPVPSTVTGNTGVPFVSGSYRPANSGTTDLFPGAAPAAPYTYTMSAFNGDTPNGTWNLYIIDDANLDGGTLSGGWTITFDVRPPAPAAGDILISEFRTRGAGTTPPGSDGSADEFIELYNNTDSSITIIDAVPGANPTSANGAGWRIGAALGATESTFFLISQTSSTAGPLAIPARGHFLLTTQPTTPSPAGNTYSLAAYPTGTGITASGVNNIVIDPASAAVGFLPDAAGLAVFSTATATSARRLDSVGYSSVTNADYKEGTGLLPAGGITTAGQHSWVRKMRNGSPQDTNNNGNDFSLVDTTGAVLNGIQSILGAPGPERAPTVGTFTTSSSPIHSNQASPNMSVALIDPTVPATQSPNFVYDATPVTNGTFGTVKLRRLLTNNTGLPIVALRYRVIQINTLGDIPLGYGDLRVLNSPQQTVATAGGNVTVQALTVQTPPAQASGGGLNTSLAEGIITTTAPLTNGGSTVVEFNFGIQTEGLFRVGLIVEALTVPPGGASAFIPLFGCAGSPIGACLNSPTAANASVEGRIFNSNGRAVTRAQISMTDSAGQTRQTSTNGLGYFRFDDVPAGETYIFRVNAKGYQPTNIIRNVAEDLTDLNIILQE